MSKMKDLLSKIIVKVNVHSTELGQLSADIDAIGTQEEIVQQVIAALGTPVFGRVEDDKDIILTATNLAEGTYTYYFEDANGERRLIGTDTVSSGLGYTNLADPTSADWLNGQRINSSGEVKAESVTYTSNYIPLKVGDVARVRGLNIFFYGSATSYATLHFYNADKVRVAQITPGENVSLFGVPGGAMANPTTDFKYTIATNATALDGHDLSEIAYARFVGRLWQGYTVNNVIITVNQEIPA